VLFDDIKLLKTHPWCTFSLDAPGARTLLELELERKVELSHYDGEGALGGT